MGDRCTEQTAYRAHGSDAAGNLPFGSGSPSFEHLLSGVDLTRPGPRTRPVTLNMTTLDFVRPFSEATALRSRMGRPRVGPRAEQAPPLREAGRRVPRLG